MYQHSMVFTVYFKAVTNKNFLRSFNGVLEMQGFRDTFSQFYSTANTSTNSSTNTTSGNLGLGTCSAGNGAASDSIIVIFVLLKIAIGLLLLSSLFFRV